MNNKHYEEIHAKFEEVSPHLASMEHDWRPRGDWGIRITLKDGAQYDYDIYSAAPRPVIKTKWEDASNLDEQQCRESFAYRLQDWMTVRGHTQGTLAAYTGLSKGVINNYLHAKATPSIVAVKKIAHALDCSVTELIE